jgi:hypothetical protein
MSRANNIVMVRQMRTGSGDKLWPSLQDKKPLAGVPLLEQPNPKSIKGILARYRRTCSSTVLQG